MAVSTSIMDREGTKALRHEGTKGKSDALALVGSDSAATQRNDDGIASGGDTSGGRFLLHMVRDIRHGRISAANLSREDRRACVDYFTAEGLTGPEVALVMKVSDRTIRRDRLANRRARAIVPGKALGQNVITDFCAQAEWAVARLRRAVRDTGDGRVTPHMRMRAEINAFRIHRELVALLAKLKYIPTGRAHLEAEARADRPLHEDAFIDKVLRDMETRNSF